MLHQNSGLFSSSAQRPLAPYFCSWVTRKSQLFCIKIICYIQSQTKLPEKVFLIMSTFLRNKTTSKTMPLRKENPFPQFNVASYKHPGIRLSFEYTATLLSGEGGEGRASTATMFRKMLPKYVIFSTVLSKIVGTLDFTESEHWAPFYCS